MDEYNLYNKGGGYRRQFGTLNLVTLVPFCCRFLPANYVTGDAGPICIVTDENLFYLLAILDNLIS